MSDSNIRSGNPFLRASEEIRATGQIVTRPRPERTAQKPASPKAALNYEPDDQELHSMISRALSAMSRGIHWVRGSILNLLV